MTAWQDQGDERYPANHARNFTYQASVAFVGRQTLETACEKQCISLFKDDRLLDFVSTVAGRKLYRSTDENGSVYCYRIHPNHTPNWHFDESPYTAIIYLENGCGGGEFELVPWARPTLSKDDVEGHEIVQQVVLEQRRDDDKVRQVQATPGSLVFFCGAKSLHRAAPIASGRRLGLVFTFGESDSFRNSLDVKNNNEWDPK